MELVLLHVPCAACNTSCGSTSMYGSNLQQLLSCNSTQQREQYPAGLRKNLHDSASNLPQAPPCCESQAMSTWSGG